MKETNYRVSRAARSTSNPAVTGSGDPNAVVTISEEVMTLVPSLTPGKSYAAVWFVSPNAIGTIERIEGESEARGMPDVKQLEILRGIGTELNGVHDSFSRAAYVIAVGASPEEALKNNTPPKG